MDKLRLTYLFGRYFNKTATPAEHDELMALLVQAENDEEVKALLAETWQQFSSERQLFSDSQGGKMLANILQKEPSEQEAPVMVMRKSPFNRVRIAAAAVLLFATTAVYFWLNSKQTSQQVSQSDKIYKNASNIIVPGGNKAVLTLADGSSIPLDSAHAGTLTQQGNAKVVKLNSATLAYNASGENSREVVYNTLSTPNGGQYQLILPDGTKVWLNAASSIHFPTLFEGKERKVTVTGEAYFEVAKNAAMPFKISVKDVDVQVFGTHFDIMAYDDENSINTTLLEGSVKVSRGAISKMLVPGQESRINKSGDIKIVDANLEEVTAWKNGWFEFNAYDIEKVMRQISRWYNVEIIFEGKIPAGHFSGSVSRENDISQVMKIIQNSGVKFKIEGRKIIFL